MLDNSWCIMSFTCRMLKSGYKYFFTKKGQKLEDKLARKPEVGGEQNRGTL